MITASTSSSHFIYSHSNPEEKTCHIAIYKSAPLPLHTIIFVENKSIQEATISFKKAMFANRGETLCIVKYSLPCHCQMIHDHFDYAHREPTAANQ